MQRCPSYCHQDWSCRHRHVSVDGHCSRDTFFDEDSSKTSALIEAALDARSRPPCTHKSTPLFTMSSSGCSWLAGRPCPQRVRSRSVDTARYNLTAASTRRVGAKASCWASTKKHLSLHLVHKPHTRRDPTGFHTPTLPSAPKPPAHLLTCSPQARTEPCSYRDHYCIGAPVTVPDSIRPADNPHPAHIYLVSTRPSPHGVVISWCFSFAPSLLRPCRARRCSAETRRLF